MDTLEPLDDEIIVDDRPAHLLARYLVARFGSGAAGIARGRAKLAPNDAEAQAWHAAADEIERTAP
jgi:hypothetical protein